jgi:hypothetical protein
MLSKICIIQEIKHGPPVSGNDLTGLRRLWQCFGKLSGLLNQCVAIEGFGNALAMLWQTQWVIKPLS